MFDYENKEEEEEIVGFIIAQTINILSCDDKFDLFSNENEQPNEVCYILTLGLKREMRRTGIGSVLLQQCIEFASRYETCGAVSYIDIYYLFYSLYNIFSHNSLFIYRFIFMLLVIMFQEKNFMKKIHFYLLNIIQVLSYYFIC